MTDLSKVSVYLASGEEIVGLADKSRLKVSSQKTDAILSEAVKAGSDTSRFLKAVADDDILRTFFLLSSRQQLNYDERFPASESFPLILSPSYDIFARLEEAYSKESKEVRDRRERTMDDIKEVNQSTFYGVIRTIFKDPAIIRARTKRAPEFKKSIDLAIERNRDETTALASGFVTKFMSVMQDFQLYNTMVSFLNIAEDARANANALDNVVRLPAERENLFAALNALAATNTVKISTESLCLDCYFKYKEEPYSSSTYNAKDIRLEPSCPRCKDPGVFHKIVVRYPSGLHRLTMPDTYWLPELVIGFKLSDLKEVSRVFIHKKVAAIVEGRGQLSGIESDVSLVTNDGRLVLVEITKQSDLENIFKVAQNKLKNAREKRIPFSSFGYITNSSSVEEFLPLGDGRNRIFFAHHIARIADFVESELVSMAGESAKSS